MVPSVYSWFRRFLRFPSVYTWLRRYIRACIRGPSVCPSVRGACAVTQHRMGELRDVYILSEWWFCGSACCAGTGWSYHTQINRIWPLFLRWEPTSGNGQKLARVFFRGTYYLQAVLSWGVFPAASGTSRIFPEISPGVSSLRLSVGYYQGTSGDGSV